MIQLHIVSGKQAGSDIVVRRFPFVIGRAADAACKLDDPGVWERHLQVEFKRRAGFAFEAQAEALTLVNGERADRGILRNGDTLDLGSVRLVFWLARSRQKTLRVREALTWLGLFALFAAQGALIWFLLR